MGERGTCSGVRSVPPTSTVSAEVGGVRPAGGGSPYDILHQLPRPYLGQAALFQKKHGQGQPPDRGADIWGGIPQLPPRLSRRLPQCDSMVAVGPHQVADSRALASRACPGPEDNPSGENRRQTRSGYAVNSHQISIGLSYVF